MAGPYYGILRFASGRAISTHWPASGAAGTYIPMSGNEKALATSSEEYTLNSGDTIIDITQGSATGMIQFELNGQPVHSMVDMAGHAVDNAGRQRLNVPVSAGERLKLKVISDLIA